MAPSVIERIKALKANMINNGADQKRLAMILSDANYEKLKGICEDISGVPIAKVVKFSGMKIVVSDIVGDKMILITNGDCPDCQLEL